MKTLQTIQTISKIAKIVSKVISVCCIVGLCMCIVGIVCLAIGAPTFMIGDVTLETFLLNEKDTSMGSLYATMATCAIGCISSAILARFAVRYFDRELEDGTPFTLDGAKELFRLGILTICIPIGTQILAQITQALLIELMTDVKPPELELGGAVSIGAMLLVLALVCRYGAELSAENPPAAPEPPQDM